MQMPNAMVARKVFSKCFDIMSKRAGESQDSGRRMSRREEHLVCETAVCVAAGQRFLADGACTCHCHLPVRLAQPSWADSFPKVRSPALSTTHAFAHAA